MRLKLTLITAAAAIVFSACAAEPAPKNTAVAVTTPAPSVANAAIPRPVEADRISLEDAKKEYDAGTAVMIDVRTAEVFAAERIKGAVNVPFEAVASSIDKLPKGKKLIIYCS